MIPGTVPAGRGYAESDLTTRFLAIDLGAESGRAIRGDLRHGVLSLAEIHRFPNRAVHRDGGLRWDIRGLWREIRRGLDLATDGPLASVGVDTWGCDYALLGSDGGLLEDPYSYRDVRTDGVMQAVLDRLGADAIYGITGIQFLPFNTLFQLHAAATRTPEVLARAEAFLTIPDLLNYWLTGRRQCEYTNATTTQMIDARTRTWAVGLLEALDLPAGILQPITEPGTAIGRVDPDASAVLAGTPVVVPACHDTAAAVASVPAGGRTAFLSSGTWSLLGTELPAPIVTPRARELNFTNEGGVCGSTRLLKNIGGLWLLQACRRAWAATGRSYGYDELLAAAEDSPHAFRSLFDPDHRSFLHPDDMPRTIAAYCRQTDQPEPHGPGEVTRAILESLAFKYRAVLDALESLTGQRIEEIRIVGGGSRNRLLNQFTADATGRTVVAGPVEATALGNIAMQMLATGAVGSLAEARAIVERSFPVTRYEPTGAAAWDAHARRFHDYLELTCV
jgi:rhamnulokinase